MTEKTNAFNPEKKTFKMMGQEFEFQFIPSIHFQFVLNLAIKFYSKIHYLGGEVIIELSKIQDEKEKEAHQEKRRKEVNEEVQTDIYTVVAEALEGRQYEILRDVLKYQNGAEFSIETLKYQSRATEIASFMMLLINDQETFQAIQEVLSGLGKFMENPPIPSPMPNSTPSF